jgi:endonuclease YncB( thermonuclease family)
MRSYRALGICAAALYVAGRCWLGGDARPPNLPEGRYRVAEVSSGDTIVLDNQVRVRLLGVAPPHGVQKKSASPAAPAADESLAQAAAEFIRRSVSHGDVQLQFDRTRIDADGQLFGYVWYDDGERGRLLLNEELLREGLARMQPRAPCSSTMNRRLTKMADEARREHRGLWASEP